MNLDLSDDQILLAESVGRLLRGRAPGDSAWSTLAEMGLLMLPFAIENGGLGLSGAETMIVGEAFGRYLAPEPYLSSIILAGTAIENGGNADQRRALLPAILSGDRTATLADRAQITAERAPGGWLLSGRASLVLGGDAADLLIVPAESGLFVLSPGMPGLSRRGYVLHGGGSAADLELDRVRVLPEAHLVGVGAFDRAIGAGIAFLAAEAAGAMQSALDLTTEHLKTRVQFGRPLAANQALQHRAAEMLVEVEQVKSAALYAALLSEAGAAERAKGYAAVKAVIGKSSRFVAQQAVHLHGGIGVSEEHIVSHYFRRLTAIGILLGDAGTHVARLAALGGFTPG